MTCTLASGANLASATVGASSPTPRPRTEEKSRDVTTKPLGGARLNALGVRNRYMMRVLERIAVTFDDANVPLLALKGAALNLLLYPRLDERPMEDLDLLVQTEDLEIARRLLKQLGAVPGEPLVQADFCPRFHYEIEFAIGDVYPVKIDLHVRPFRPLRYSRIVSDDELWARAKRVPIGKALIFVPSAEDMLIHLAAHSAIHGNSRRMWLRDIKLWAVAHQRTIDWTRFLTTVNDWRLALPVRVGIASASREFGRICPDDVVRRLSQIPATWRDRLALWQAPRDASHPVAHVLANVACTPGLKFSLAYLLAVTMPSRPHIADWYRWRHWGWFPCAQLFRWLAPIVAGVTRPGRRFLQMTR